MRLLVMVEGQEDVTWAQWMALARATEDAGLEGMFRSDHYQSVVGRTDRASLEPWSTLAALGPLTSRIRLGTMVSPTSFRHPSVLAKSAVTADHTSDGRTELGLGAGWNELEHTTYGFPFHDLGTRFEVFEEQVEIIARQFREERFDFDGTHHHLHDCEARPKPVQDRLPIIIGGGAGPRSLRIAVAWADEYNTYHDSLERLEQRHARIVAATDQAGRTPLAHSAMTGMVIGHDDAEVQDRAHRVHERLAVEDPYDQWFAQVQESWVVGTLDQAGSQLADRFARGVSRVFLQHHLHEDLDTVALLGQLA